MRPFWYPQSALLLPDPPGPASTGILRMLLARGPRLELLYAGDRMWPTIRNGQRVLVESVRREDIRAGAIVLCSVSGVPDLLRVLRFEKDRVRLQGDADPHETFLASPAEILGAARVPHSPFPHAPRALRRVWLDLREAVRGRPDPAVDLASTVKTKYQAQAPFYANLVEAPVPAVLLDLIRARVREKGRVLVAGSGTGRESIALAAQGWTVVGVDFSPAMVDLARKKAAESAIPESALRFALADLTTLEEDAGALAAIYFTYDVYSFIPEATTRTALLRRMCGWLEPGGTLLLSARRMGRSYDVAILSLQRAVRGVSARARFGDSHTRWLAADGSLHRSFVHVFTRRSIEREAAAAGFRTGRWVGNHCVLTRARDAS